jgi:hypothetical protein
VDHDIVVTPTGVIRARRVDDALDIYGDVHRIGPVELRRLCKKKPRVVIVGTGLSCNTELTADGRQYLRRQRIAMIALPTPEAIACYQSERRPSALLLHLGCRTSAHSATVVPATPGDGT